MVTPQQVQQTAMMNPYLTPDLRNDPYGFNELLSTESPFVNTDAEIQKIREESLRNKDLNPYAGKSNRI